MGAEDRHMEGLPSTELQAQGSDIDPWWKVTGKNLSAPTEQAEVRRYCTPGGNWD